MWLRDRVRAEILANCGEPARRMGERRARGLKIPIKAD
jgi:hypothetical protein